MATSKDVVVTGVSSGVGFGTTKVLASKGSRVFGSVRKQADADHLQKSSVTASCHSCWTLRTPTLSMAAGCAETVTWEVTAADGRRMSR